MWRTVSVVTVIALVFSLLTPVPVLLKPEPESSLSGAKRWLDFSVTMFGSPTDIVDGSPRDAVDGSHHPQVWADGWDHSVIECSRNWAGHPSVWGFVVCPFSDLLLSWTLSEVLFPLPNLFLLQFPGLKPFLSVFLLPEKGIIKSQRVFDVLLATDRGHYIKYFPYMDSPQSIGKLCGVPWNCSCGADRVAQGGLCAPKHQLSFTIGHIGQIPSIFHLWVPEERRKELFHT